ncbi:MAG: glutathione S-transferase family protein [Myxococcota bacterium]|nr:glutathione S-transferase family protein [Myxococcota bacterium]MEC8424943.1 glutathione S-transferase family protein [Myxococcota bacterium]
MNHQRTVVVYGVDHSPWVQGVRMALHHQGIPHTLTSVPFGPDWWLRRGLVFPAMRVGDAPVLTDSFRIYESLEEAGASLGVKRLSQAERTSAQVELERLFTRYALGRCANGKDWAFFRAWSTMQETPATRTGAAVRGLLSLYFWVLIRVGIRLRTRRGLPAVDLAEIRSFLAPWNARLERAPWLTGGSLGFLDFALLGHLQCMASGPTDEMLPLVQAFPALMAWQDRMVAELAGHRPLYVRRFRADTSAGDEREPARRGWFWVGWSAGVLGWPLTMLLVIHALVVRNWNPGHSGAATARARR